MHKHHSSHKPTSLALVTAQSVSFCFPLKKENRSKMTRRWDNYDNIVIFELTIPLSSTNLQLKNYLVSWRLKIFINTFTCHFMARLKPRLVEVSLWITLLKHADRDICECPIASCHVRSRTIWVFELGTSVRWGSLPLIALPQAF